MFNTLINTSIWTVRWWVVIYRPELQLPALVSKIDNWPVYLRKVSNEHGMEVRSYPFNCTLYTVLINTICFPEIFFFYYIADQITK